MITTTAYIFTLQMQRLIRSRISVGNPVFPVNKIPASLNVVKGTCGEDLRRQMFTRLHTTAHFQILFVDSTPRTDNIRVYPFDLGLHLKNVELIRT